MKPETAIRDRRGIVRRIHSETVIRVDKRGIFRGNSFRLCVAHLVILSLYLGCIFMQIEDLSFLRILVEFREIQIIQLIDPFF